MRKPFSLKVKMKDRCNSTYQSLSSHGYFSILGIFTCTLTITPLRWHISETWRQTIHITNLFFHISLQNYESIKGIEDSKKLWKSILHLLFELSWDVYKVFANGHVFLHCWLCDHALRGIESNRSPIVSVIPHFVRGSTFRSSLLNVAFVMYHKTPLSLARRMPMHGSSHTKAYKPEECLERLENCALQLAK